MNNFVAFHYADGPTHGIMYCSCLAMMEVSIPDEIIGFYQFT
jgi:hypothetical protein